MKEPVSLIDKLLEDDRKVTPEDFDQKNPRRKPLRRNDPKPTAKAASQSPVLRNEVQRKNSFEKFKLKNLRFDIEEEDRAEQMRAAEHHNEMDANENPFTCHKMTKPIKSTRDLRSSPTFEKTDFETRYHELLKVNHRTQEESRYLKYGFE